MRSTRSSHAVKRVEAGRFLLPIWSCSGRGLPCGASCKAPGGLLHRLFTLTRPLFRTAGRFVSVALSVAAVFPLPSCPIQARQPALWSPDFPPCNKCCTAIGSP